MKIKLGNVVACEYVADGANRKHTLVNVFSGDILVGEMPTLIPIAFYVELVPDFTEELQTTIDIKRGNKMAASLNFDIDFKAGHIALIVIQGALFRFDQDTTIQLVMKTPKTKPMTILKKSISVGPFPTS